jgi:hypothetical protein
VQVLIDGEMTGQDAPNVLHWINEFPLFFKTRTAARKTVFFWRLQPKRLIVALPEDPIFFAAISTRHFAPIPPSGRNVKCGRLGATAKKSADL